MARDEKCRRKEKLKERGSEAGRIGIGTCMSSRVVSQLEECLLSDTRRYCKEDAREERKKKKKVNTSTCTCGRALRRGSSMAGLRILLYNHLSSLRLAMLSPITIYHSLHPHIYTEPNPTNTVKAKHLLLCVHVLRYFPRAYPLLPHFCPLHATLGPSV
jgi:hypothetical protein